MKKILYVCVSFFILVSCEVLEKIELKVENNLTEYIPVRISQTTGMEEFFDFTNTVNIHSGDFAQYEDKITELKIVELSYRFIDFTGDSNGSITLGTLKFDDLVIAEMTDLIVATAASSGTVFRVTDVEKLNRIASSFIGDSDVVVSLKGAVLSEMDAMDFKIELRLEMIATLKD